MFVQVVWRGVPAAKKIVECEQKYLNRSSYDLGSESCFHLELLKADCSERQQNSTMAVRQRDHDFNHLENS
jgi:hypothetical protein